MFAILTTLWSFTKVTSSLYKYNCVCVCSNNLYVIQVQSHLNVHCHFTNLMVNVKFVVFENAFQISEDILRLSEN